MSNVLEVTVTGLAQVGFIFMTTYIHLYFVKKVNNVIEINQKLGLKLQL